MSRASWMIVALRELGVAEVPGPGNNPRIIEYDRATTLKATSDLTPWCSAFTNWVLQQAGIPGTGSAAARSWLAWGQRISAPDYGAITVLSRGGDPTQGHVGFCLDADADFVWLLAGNQGDAVSLAAFPIGRVLGYRVPFAR